MIRQEKYDQEKIKKDRVLLSDVKTAPHIRYRISATSACNHQCFFCHNEGEPTKLVHLAPEPLQTFLQTGSSVGVCEVILTGGEWTISPYASGLLSVLDQYTPESAILALTSNGALLQRFIPLLIRMRPVQLRISLHSIDPTRFQSITNSPLVPVLRSIEACCEAGLYVTLNIVMCRQNGIRETLDIIKYAASVGVAEVKVLDLLSPNPEVGGISVDMARDAIDPQMLIETLSDDYTIDQVDEPSKKLGSTIISGTYKGMRVKIKTSMAGLFHGKVCMTCSMKSKCREGLYALRLTPELKLKSCLLRQELDVNLGTELCSKDVLGATNRIKEILATLWFNTLKY